MATKLPTLTGNDHAGRPTKRTKKLVDELLDASRSGAPYNIACAAVGIHPDTFGDWRRRDPAFAREVDQVAAQGALRRLKKIEQHGEENFAALAWLLERRYPQEFSRPEVQLNLAIQNNTAGPTNVVVLGPERASLLANRCQEIREKTKQLVDGRNSDARVVEAGVLEQKKVPNAAGQTIGADTGNAERTPR